MAKDGISEVDVWGRREFGGAKLGDTRRTERLVSLAVGLAQRPGIAISSACGRSGAQAVSRLLSRKEVTVKSVLSEHTHQSSNRCREYGWIFAIQDTTTLDFTSHPATEGLGPISHATKSLGLIVHTVLLVNETKTPVGVADVQLWARSQDERNKAETRRHRLVKDKESRKWLEGLKAAESAVPKECSLLVIGDRESDIFALFVAPRQERTHLLVRSTHNRAVDEELKYLAEVVASAPVVGEYELEVPRQGKRSKRVARLKVRAVAVTVKAPRHKTPDITEDVADVWLVQAKEIDAPEGVEPLEWTLVSTKPVCGLDDAVWLLKAYAARWVIEEFHRVLKTGCAVEEMQLDSVARLKPAIAINMVVAWRILYITKISREKPDEEALTVATGSEIDMLGRWLRSKGEKLTQVKTVRDFVLAAAYLGGFMSRSRDAKPGVQVLWEGLKRLEDLLIGYRLATEQEIR